MRWLACSVLWWALPLAVVAQTPDNQLSDTLEQLEATRQQADVLKGKLDQAQKRLDEVQSKAVTLGGALQRTEASIAKKNDALAVLRRELAAKQEAQQARRADIATLMHGMIRMQRLPRQFVVAQPGDASTVLRTASALDVTYRAVDAEMALLQQQVEEIGKLQARVNESADALHERQAALQEEQTALGEVVQERQQQFEALNRNHRDVSRKVTALSAQSTSLQDLIGRLKQEEAIFAQMGTPTPKPKAPRRSETTLASLPPEPAASASTRAPAGIQAARGRLLHRYGEKAEDGGKRSGDVVETVPAAVVTAPKAGQVVFSGPFMEYGNMVIIQHDGGIHSVLAGMSQMKVAPGQRLRAGEPLGVMGNTLSERELYLELRKDSKPIDPSAFMGNLTDRVAGVSGQ